MKKILNIALISLCFSTVAQDIEKPSFTRDVLPQAVINVVDTVAVPTYLTGLCTLAGTVILDLKQKGTLPFDRFTKGFFLGAKLIGLSAGLAASKIAAQKVQAKQREAGRILTQAAIRERDFQASALANTAYATFATTFFLKRVR